MDRTYRGFLSAEVLSGDLVEAIQEMAEKCPVEQLSVFMAARIIEAGRSVLLRLGEHLPSLDSADELLEDTAVSMVERLVDRTKVPGGMTFYHVDILRKAATKLAARIKEFNKESK